MQTEKFQSRRNNHPCMKRSPLSLECPSRILFCLTKITLSKNSNQSISPFFLPSNKSSHPYRLHYSSNTKATKRSSKTRKSFWKTFKKSSITMLTSGRAPLRKNQKIRKYPLQQSLSKKVDLKKSIWKFNSSSKSSTKSKNSKLSINEKSLKLHL